MPTFRWFGRRLVTSLSAMRMLPAVGSSKPATMRSVVVLPQPLGPRKETNSPRWIARSTFCTTCSPPKLFFRFCSSRNAMCSCLGAAGRGRCAPHDVDQPHAGPGDDEGDDGERRRLVGAVGADQLQVRAECR